MEQRHLEHPAQPHKPVLVREVTELAATQADSIYVDLTAGYGGHATALLETMGSGAEAWLIDQDSEAITSLRERFSSDERVRIVHTNFASLDWKTMPLADVILLDLGVNSHQLDAGERGFSFQQNGPLDMRMNVTAPTTAADIVNQLSESAIAEIIWRYGEDRRSRQIAKAICQQRSTTPIRTTQELTAIIHGAIGSGGRINSATKTFQALRIAVNDELSVLEAVIPRATSHLKPHGRLLIISFHSLEDRIVKTAFRTLTKIDVDPITGQPIHDPAKPSFTLVTKKPLTAAPDEIDTNPRSRSAKLRVVEKQN